MQEPWIVSGSVRENITLHAPFDADRYAAVLHACMLEQDLKQLPFGEETMVGERGIALSGGQRAHRPSQNGLSPCGRILIDDPLSAVDPHVGAMIFERLVCTFLKGRLRLLVTHQMQYLARDEVSRIVVLRAGTAVAQGAYEELLPLELPELRGLQETAAPAPLHSSSLLNLSPSIRPPQSPHQSPRRWLLRHPLQAYLLPAHRLQLLLPQRHLPRAQHLSRLGRWLLRPPPRNRQSMKLDV